MKLVVVSFALTIFSGCRAFVLRDESRSKVDQLRKDLSEYAEQLYPELFKKPALVEKSDIGKALGSWSHDMGRNLEKRLEALGDELPTEAQEVRRQVNWAIRRLQRKVVNSLVTLHKKLSPEREAFRQALEADLEPVLEKLDPHLRPWLRRSVQTGTELNAQLDELLKWQLEALQPRAGKFRAWVQGVQGFFDATADQLQEQLKLGLETAHDALRRSATRALEVWGKYREGFDQWAGP